MASRDPTVAYTKRAKATGVLSASLLKVPHAGWGGVRSPLPLGLRVLSSFSRAPLEPSSRRPRVTAHTAAKAKAMAERAEAVIANHERAGVKCLWARPGLVPWPPKVVGWVRLGLTPRAEDLFGVAHRRLRSSQASVFRFTEYSGVRITMHPSAYTFSYTS